MHISLPLWLINNWPEIALPTLVIIACYVIGLWIRRAVDRAFEAWTGRTKWEGGQVVVRTTRRPFLLWFLLLGIGIAIEISVLPVDIKSIAGKATGSLFISSLGWLAIILSEQLLGQYLPKIKVPQPTSALIMNFIRITFIVTTMLVVLDIWGIPTTPLLLLIISVVLVVMLATRNVAPNLFAWFQLEAGQQIKVGDYIKLEQGQEGCVVDINWNNTRIKTRENSMVIIPNNWLLQHPVVIHGDSRIILENGAKSDEKKVDLSEREKEIAKLVSEGISNKEIANRLFIAENTVKVHMKNILKKLELRNRQQLAAYTVLQNWAGTENENKSG